MRRDLCDLSNEVMVKHFCIDVLSILILKMYKYWSSLLVCLYDESVSNFSSSYLSLSVPMNKDNFQKQFFLLFSIFCTVPSFVRIIPITKIIRKIIRRKRWMYCNVVRISLETGNRSAYIFALQRQLVSLQIVVS